MVFSITFKNSSVILRQSSLLTQETQKTTDLSEVADTLYFIMLYKLLIIKY